MPKSLDFEVPERSYAIFPTTVPYHLIPVGFGTSPGALLVIARGQIQGRALMRNYPFWRLWVIR